MPPPAPPPPPSALGPNLSELESIPPEAAEPAPSLELESVPAPAPPEAGPATAPLASAEAPSPSPAAEPAPSGDPDDLLLPADTTPLPPTEISAAADYGPAPGFTGAIPYALQVYGRRKELVAEINEAENHRKSAEADVETALAALGRAIADKADALGGALGSLAEDLEGARAAVDLVGSRKEASIREEAEREERKRTLQAELEALERELAPHQDRETKLQTQLEVKEQELARARAKHQRAAIEARNAAADPQVTPERRALAEADLERYDEERVVAEQALAEVTDKLAEIKRELAARLGQRSEIERSLAHLDREAHATKRIQLASESDAESRARRALARLGRRAIEAGVAESASPDLVGRVSRADEVLARRRRRERLLRAAIDGYHKPTVYQGVAILGTAALVVVLFVLFAIGRALF